MPIYQLICPHCGPVELVLAKARSVEQAPCPTCQRTATRDWGEPKGFRPFQSYWTDHLPTEPGRKHVFVDSKAKEEALCKKAKCVRVS